MYINLTSAKIAEDCVHQRYVWRIATDRVKETKIEQRDGKIYFEEQ